MKKQLNLKEALHFAEKIARLVKPGDILLFQGDLGTGKSTLIRKIIQTLAGHDIDVPSPTFTLVQTYKAPPLILWHFDLYRLETVEEIHELGMEEAFDGGVSFIEWPERLGYLRPKEYLLINLTHGDHPDERQITLSPTPSWAERVQSLA